MLLWILAVLLMAVIGLIGYYQGAVRVAFSLLGLILGAVLAIPLAFIFKWFLPFLTLKHPVLLAFITPALVYILILIAFKVAGLSVHKKIDTYYKYNSTDTRRLLFARLNQRLGICLGIVNAVVYVFLVSIVAYLLGYFTIQVSMPGRDSLGVKFANSLVRSLQSSGMDRAVAPCVPATETYYDAADILGNIYHNPLLQSRLSRYPVFVMVAERQDFKSLGGDAAFQEFWQKGPSVAELMKHPKLKPIISDVALYTNVMAMLGGDLKDLKSYLETGISAKYDDEKILGRWDFTYRESMSRAKRRKPNMTLADIKFFSGAFRGMVDSYLIAAIDNRAILKVPPSGGSQNLEGTWRRESSAKYVVSLSEGGKTLELPALIESTKLILTKENRDLVFEK
jgi:uncharacterized membrane protein required for colicin V production